jgi:type II restriction enzyme
MINIPRDLITSDEETRAGFIEFALEKNRRSKPFIESAKSFKYFACKASTPKELKKIPEIRLPLITASGLSDKAMQYFTEADINIAIDELIKNFLEPASKDFVDEVVYRYLLIKGDSFGGSIRNAIGALAEQKFIRCLLSVMNTMSVYYYWLPSGKESAWQKQPPDDYGIENSLKAISWNRKGKE